MGLYCLDSLPDDVTVGGVKLGSDYNQLHILFTPCNFISEKIGAVGTQECISDLAEQLDYLGSPRVVYYFNYDEFVQLGFGEEAV